MQDKSRSQRLSRLRLELRRFLERLRQILAAAPARTPLVKGHVYQIARRCGTPHCHCTRGQLHRTMVLTWSEHGRTQRRFLAPPQVAVIRPKSEEYRRLRRTRAEVSVILKKILRVLDQIQELRFEEP